MWKNISDVTFTSGIFAATLSKFTAPKISDSDLENHCNSFPTDIVLNDILECMEGVFPSFDHCTIVYLKVCFAQLSG